MESSFTYLRDTFTITICFVEEITFGTKDWNTSTRAKDFVPNLVVFTVFRRTNAGALLQIEVSIRFCTEFCTNTIAFAGTCILIPNEIFRTRLWVAFAFASFLVLVSKGATSYFIAHALASFSVKEMIWFAVSGMTNAIANIMLKTKRLCTFTGLAGAFTCFEVKGFIFVWTLLNLALTSTSFNIPGKTRVACTRLALASA